LRAVVVVQDEHVARKRFYEIKSQANGTQIQHAKNTLNDINKRLAGVNKLLKAAFEKSILSGELLQELEREYEAEK